MNKKEQILDTLDNSNDGFYKSFVILGDTYSYLIDSRLNVFRNDFQWAIAVERLGYNPRGGMIELEIYYYGNCLEDLEEYNNRKTNSYLIYPVENENFLATTHDEIINNDAEYWMVRGKKVHLTHNRDDYANAGITLDNHEGIGIAEAARFLIIEQPDMFRASDKELYKSIPQELEKILSLNQWYHKDFDVQKRKPMDIQNLRAAYELNKQFSPHISALTFEEFVEMIRRQEMVSSDFDKEEWEKNRPSSYETWQQLADVIVTGDVTHYRPNLPSNSHWSHFPESGSM